MSGCFLHTSIKYDLEIFSLLSANGFNISNIISKKVQTEKNEKQKHNSTVTKQTLSSCFAIPPFEIVF